MNKSTYEALLKLTIDKNSLADVNKRLARERFQINAQINVLGTEQINHLSQNLLGLIHTASNVSQALSPLANGSKSILDLSSSFLNLDSAAETSRIKINEISKAISDQSTAWEALNTSIQKADHAQNNFTSAVDETDKSSSNLKENIVSIAEDINTFSDLAIKLMGLFETSNGTTGLAQL